ncbi:hypothetical protein ACFS07_17290 [Undibacterium arcticum]
MIEAKQAAIEEDLSKKRMKAARRKLKKTKVRRTVVQPCAVSLNTASQALRKKVIPAQRFDGVEIGLTGA